MSAIRESGIGFGGIDEVNDRPSPENVNLNSAVTSPPPVINLDSKLLEAKKRKQNDDTIQSKSKIWIGGELKTEINKKSLDESKKLLTNFKSALMNISYYMSYEGSMVVCVLLSLDSSTFTVVKMKALPDIDKNMILEIIGNDCGMIIDSINVRFDEYKNFHCFVMYADKVGKQFSLINTVANPRKEDLDDVINNTVSIKDDGDKISLGNGIVVDKKHIQRLIGVIPVENKKESIDPETIPMRQSVSGRNAFEIRTDVLQMSLDFSRGKNYTEEQIIATAKKFYSFVENKR